MRVKAELKITILEGEEKGKTFDLESIGETDTIYGKVHSVKLIGDPVKIRVSRLVTERLKLEWFYQHRDVKVE